MAKYSIWSSHFVLFQCREQRTDDFPQDNISGVCEFCAALRFFFHQDRRLKIILKTRCCGLNVVKVFPHCFSRKKEPSSDRRKRSSSV